MNFSIWRTTFWWYLKSINYKCLFYPIDGERKGDCPTAPQGGLFFSAAFLRTVKSNLEMETELGGVWHGPAIMAIFINPSLKQTLPLTEAEWNDEGRGKPVSPWAEGMGHRHDDSPADGLSTETDASLMSCALHASQREAAAG